MSNDREPKEFKPILHPFWQRFDLSPKNDRDEFNEEVQRIMKENGWDQ